MRIQIFLLGMLTGIILLEAAPSIHSFLTPAPPEKNFQDYSCPPGTAAIKSIHSTKVHQQPNSRGLNRIKPENRVCMNASQLLDHYISLGAYSPKFSPDHSQ